jgi:hypothetical protein
MTTEVQTAATPAPASSAPDDRATTFQAVQGSEAQHYSGEVLLVSAYALLWTVLLVWVAFLWRKQSVINDRLGDLERVIGLAARPASPAKPASEGPKGAQ